MDERGRRALELQRLRGGGQADPAGVPLARFVVRTSGEPAAVVIDRACEVLRCVNEASSEDWPSDEDWSALLPAWFVQRCPPERTDEEEKAWLKKWRAMTWEEKQRCEANEGWSLPNWIHWFRPEERTWYWWDAEIVGADTALVDVEADGWPFPSGALSWLLRASGAASVQEE